MPSPLYTIKGKGRKSSQIDYYKHYTQTQRAKDECLESQSCLRFRLNCALFPIVNQGGKLTDECAERLPEIKLTKEIA